MPDLLIKDVDDGIIRAVELQAEVTGQSIEAVARELLRIGLLHDGEGRTAVSRYIRSLSPGPISEDSTAMIRRLRDAM